MSLFEVSPRRPSVAIRRMTAATQTIIEKIRGKYVAVARAVGIGHELCTSSLTFVAIAEPVPPANAKAGSILH